MLLGNPISALISGIMLRMIGKRADLVVAVTKEIKDYLLHHGICDQNILVVNNGAALRPFE